MNEDPRNIASKWTDAHLYSPAPRHRRRILLNMVRSLSFQTCLDAGCAQPYLLKELAVLGKDVSGCDISPEVIECNRRLFPGIDFEEVDISESGYPGAKKFDLVISSEVLEHIDDWRAALKNITSMARRYVLITVPGGNLRNIDKMVGHKRHFKGDDLRTELEKNGFEVRIFKRWGFPLHTAYKYLINLPPYEARYERYACSRYGIVQRTMAEGLYILFFVNDFCSRGQQIFLLAERSETA